MKKQVTVSLGKQIASKKDLRVKEVKDQPQLNEHFKALIKDEANGKKNFQSHRSNDSMDLVQMEDVIEPKKSHSPGSP
jgi:hypothetical protein